MRDWLMTGELDRDCLHAAKREESGGNGTWRPWRGMYARARRLAKDGFLKVAGTSAMPPHVLYVITDKGCEELQVAELLASAKD